MTNSDAQPAVNAGQTRANQSAIVGQPTSDIPALVQKLLQKRGLKTREEMMAWLSPSLKDLRDPNSIVDMKPAVERLVKAFREGTRIAIYADYDLDGTSGLALFKKGLEGLGFKDLLHYQPSRLKEGYGLNKKSLDHLRSQGAEVIVSIDLGISNALEVDYARDLGMDVIVTDHHLPPDLIPDTLAVVNPNRRECTSELKHLCGAGVAFFLLLALRREMFGQGLLANEFDLKQLLDCFVIATLTDMVPLIAENRILAKHGLKLLPQSQRPGLRYLALELGLSNRISSRDLGMKFAPKLNALSRLELGVLPLDLYLIEDPVRARDLVREILGVNENRKALQVKAETIAREELAKNPPKDFIWVFSTEFHRGILGLLATKLTGEFGLPCFVGSLLDAKIVGSARLPKGSDLKLPEVLQKAAQALVQFGGHAQAAGFELKADQATAFGAALITAFAEISTEEKTVSASDKVHAFDVEATLSELNIDFMRWYDHMEPFGVGNEVPVFLLRTVKVSSSKELKGGHLRLTLDEATDGNRLSRHQGIWFSPPKSAAALVKAGNLVNVWTEVGWNEYQGARSLQLQIVHLTPAL